MKVREPGTMIGKRISFREPVAESPTLRGTVYQELFNWRGQVNRVAVNNITGEPRPPTAQIVYIGEVIGFTEEK